MTDSPKPLIIQLEKKATLLFYQIYLIYIGVSTQAPISI